MHTWTHIIHVTCIYNDIMYMYTKYIFYNTCYMYVHAQCYEHKLLCVCTCIHNTRHLYSMYYIIHVTCMYNDIMYMYT